MLAVRARLGLSSSPSPVVRRRAERWISSSRLVDLDRLAIEVGIGKQFRGLLEVHDGEVELAVILVDAGAAADDLLELVIDWMGWSSTISLQVWASTPVVISSRGGGDDRIAAFRVDEVVEFRLAFGSSPVIRMTYLRFSGDKVGVLVDQRLPHPLGVVDVFAEDDGLVVAVASP